MKKLKIYIATSANGYIAESDGGVAWLDELPHKEGEDYSYYDFMSSIDTTIQGYSTYQQILDWGIEFPYKETKNYVVTHKVDPHNNGHVSFISKNIEEEVQRLKAEEGKDIWLIGGGKLNGTLLNANLVDEVIIHQMPIFLGSGIPLISGLDRNVFLTPPDVKTYDSGVVEFKYHLK